MIGFFTFGQSLSVLCFLFFTSLSEMWAPLKNDAVGERKAAGFHCSTRGDAALETPKLSHQGGEEKSDFDRRAQLHW